jgi:hypothetical protein
MPDTPNYSMLLRVASELFRLGTVAPSRVVRCGSGPTHRITKKVKKSKGYGLGMRLAQLLGKGGFHAITTNKNTKGRDK